MEGGREKRKEGPWTGQGQRQRSFMQSVHLEPKRGSAVSSIISQSIVPPMRKRAIDEKYRSRARPSLSPHRRLRINTAQITEPSPVSDKARARPAPQNPPSIPPIPPSPTAKGRSNWACRGLGCQISLFGYLLGALFARGSGYSDAVGRGTHPPRFSFVLTVTTDTGTTFEALKCRNNKARSLTYTTCPPLSSSSRAGSVMEYVNEDAATCNRPLVNHVLSAP